MARASPSAWLLIRARQRRREAFVPLHVALAIADTDLGHRSSIH
jgi:hypothetical protein